jgi:hypothetical protein
MRRRIVIEPITKGSKAMHAIGRLFAVAIAFAPLAAIAQQPQAPLASEPTNWAGVTADITDFKRKGSTLTVRVRLHNDGGKDAYVEFTYEKCYLLDAAAGKKYQVLKDDAGAAIAAVNAGNEDWRGTIKAGQSQTIWMKFPAPPATVKSVSLSIDNAPPFDDLAIQDAP